MRSAYLQSLYPSPSDPPLFVFLYLANPAYELSNTRFVLKLEKTPVKVVRLPGRKVMVNCWVAGVMMSHLEIGSNIFESLKKGVVHTRHCPVDQRTPSSPLSH
jgi:hypothetical protein